MKRTVPEKSWDEPVHGVEDGLAELLLPLRLTHHVGAKRIL